MREWLRKWLGIDSFEARHRQAITIADQRWADMVINIGNLEAEMQTRLDENRFLSRKLDMLSQGVVPPAPEIIKGQDEAQEC